MAYENTSFPRVLSLMRKEKNISQKSAASDLGISQALLSHYEKGIRRPNLDFLVRCADYYEVSCDYLLGRSPERQGSTITIDELPNPEDAGRGNVGVRGVLSQLNNKLIANSLNILFDLLTKLGNKNLTSEVSAYIMLSVYRMFRVIYSANSKNEKAMFELPEVAVSQYTNATMQIVEANAIAISQGKPLRRELKPESPNKVVVSTESLANDYPLFSTSLLNLVQNAEKKIGYRKSLTQK